MRRVAIIALLLISLPVAGTTQELRLPNKAGSLKFAVIGDTGQPGSGQTGDRPPDGRLADTVPVRVRPDDGRQPVRHGDSRRLREEVCAAVQSPPGQRRQVLRRARQPRRRRADQLQGVQHERREVLHLQAASSARGSSRSTATTSTTSSCIGSSKELEASGSDWKIVFFHHPLYSSGSTHGSADLQRGLIEPVFLKYGVNVAFRATSTSTSASSRRRASRTSSSVRRRSCGKATCRSRR